MKYTVWRWALVRTHAPDYGQDGYPLRKLMAGFDPHLRFFLFDRGSVLLFETRIKAKMAANQFSDERYRVARVKVQIAESRRA